MDSEQFFLDLPAFTEVLGTWMQSKNGQWRPNVLRFSLNLLDDLQPRAITRDLDWGVPVPLDGWRDRPDKRIYVWFDAVIGYLSASIEWARRSGDPDAWRAWWQSEDAESYYFMGKDNIVFHSEIWPAMLLGYSGKGAKNGTPGSLGALNLPTDVVASEFLTMEGRKFSSSRSVVIYVRDFLARYDVDALRYYVAVAGPENQDTDFTWSEFVRRNNDELVATWGNLVNRAVSFAARNIGEIPGPGTLTDTDHEALERSRQAFGAVGGELARSHFKNAATEAMRTVAEANKYMSDQAPWKLRESDPDRMRTILHVVLQLVDDAKTLLTPFLPRSSGKVHAMLGGEGTWAGLPHLEKVDEDGGPSYPVITGDYSQRSPVGAGPGPAGHPARRSAAAVRQARHVRGGRGTEAAGGLVTAARAARDGVPGPGQVPAPEPLPAPALDAHCHLDLIEQPAGEVLAAARAAGITRVITVGVDLPSSRWSAEYADDAAGRLRGGGDPPQRDRGRGRLGRAAGRGARRDREAGGPAAGPRGRRDRARLLPGLRRPEVQRDWFRAHIEIAKQAGKALMIHDRDAHEDVLAILAADGPPERVVFHCFSGDAAMAKRCAAAGYVMSFAGTVTFTNAPALREAAAVAPPDLLLVETDAPFLTPMPHRGKPNTPAMVAHTVRCLASVKQVGVADMCGLVTATGERMFGPW